MFKISKLFPYPLQINPKKIDRTGTFPFKKEKRSFLLNLGVKGGGENEKRKSNDYNH
jgi:hypothetical protein